MLFLRSADSACGAEGPWVVLATELDLWEGQSVRWEGQKEGDLGEKNSH